MQVALHDNHVVMDTAAAAFVRSKGVSPLALDVRGRTLAALPHTRDAVQFFRNIGTTLPLPMEYQYQWTGRLAPYDHQRVTADFLASHEKAFCLNSPGTGKTASALWAADYLRTQGKVRKILVLCTKTNMSSVWADDIRTFTPHLTSVVVSGTKAARDKLLSAPSDVVIINHDGVKTCGQYLVDDDTIDLVIVDECTAFKNESTDRAKWLKKVTAGRMLWAMTGTPNPQNPVDAYFMCKMINPNAPRTKSQFQAYTMQRVGEYRWVPRQDAADTVFKYMQPAIRFDKKDCLDMPPVVKTYMSVPLTDKQQAAHDALRKDWAVNLRSGGNAHSVTAPNAAVRVGKLLQVSCGTLLDDKKVTHEIGAENKLEALLELIRENDGKVLVFTPFVGSMHYIQKFLEKHKITSAIINGAVSENDRRMIVSDFQRGRDPHVIIAHPKTASHGLTLTAANLTVWFGPTYSVESYEQANNRMDRPGQTRSMRIVHLFSTTQERAVFRTLEQRGDLQTTLLDLYREAVED